MGTSIIVDVISAVDDFFYQQDESIITNGIQAQQHYVNCKWDYIEK